jgi:hypothetical protein
LGDGVRIKMKKYCKNCTWFDFDCLYGFSSEHFSETDHTGIGRKWKNYEEWKDICKKYNIDINDYNSIDKGIVSCCNFNKDFNCPFYEKRWYKFWIK